MSEDINTDPITQKDLLDMAFGNADPLEPARVIATYADECRWYQVHDENGCHWAMKGPTCPPYELAQQTMKRLGLDKRANEHG